MAGELRASDADRDRTAGLLREHFGVGRLDQEELDERIRRAYDAKTEGELAALLVDLPALPVTRAEARRELAERRRHLRRRVLQESGGGLGLFWLCTGIWAVSGAHGFFWPVFTLILFVGPLVSRGWALYGPGADLDRLEAELDEGEKERRRRRSDDGERGGARQEH
jgi:hypothetical protein